MRITFSLSWWANFLLTQKVIVTLKWIVLLLIIPSDSFSDKRIPVARISRNFQKESLCLTTHCEPFTSTLTHDLFYFGKAKCETLTTGFSRSCWLQIINYTERRKAIDWVLDNVIGQHLPEFRMTALVIEYD